MLRNAGITLRSIRASLGSPRQSGEANGSTGRVEKPSKPHLRAFNELPPSPLARKEHRHVLLVDAVLLSELIEHVSLLPICQ